MPGRVLTDEEALQLILEPGFSTASTVTQHAGRGVGMDVVVNEIKKLGGALFTESQPGTGVKFTIRLPFTLAITQALIVRTGEELYALPLPSVEGVARVPRSEVQKHLAEDSPTFTYGEQVYRFQHLGAFVGGGASVLPEADVSMPVILIRAGEHSTAVVTDELVGSREMVVKSVGPQIAAHPRHRRRDDPRRRPHRHHSRPRRAGALRMARPQAARSKVRRRTAARSRWSSTTRSPCAA